MRTAYPLAAPPALFLLPVCHLIVTGCLAQRYKEEIIQEIPEVDAVLGTTSYEEIAHVIDGVLSDSPMERGDVRLTMKDVDYLPVTDTHRMVTTGGHFAYLKIAEGCDKHCTYCIIPKLRGSYRSHSMDYLIKQAESLATQGVKELNIVAQETTVYGTDLYNGQKMLPELLKRCRELRHILTKRLSSL